MGLEKVFKDIFPIDYNDRMSLEYVSYELGALGMYLWKSNRYSKSLCMELFFM